ncbi:MAG: two-component system response regulator [Cypionkella sp.]|uniref:response regulator n=1 Tax=Cypionkella sp. TaxID=2811411 RepID=UPI00260B30C2|nr:response regulator [Cypionkella sp.]MDB5661117.1 two-component system response regulator [Cypionkella sp.]
MKNGWRVVLVVEDSFLIRLNALDTIARTGYEALEAQNADEAILILETRQDIDLVFTDVQMPGSMDGIELCQYVRILWPHVKLLVASGVFQLQEQSLPSGCIFLSKPYSDRAITNAITKLLGV